jgi:hypothetical protein
LTVHITGTSWAIFGAANRTYPISNTNTFVIFEHTFPPLVMVELALFRQCTGGKVPVAAIYWWKHVSSTNGNAKRQHQ